MKDRKPGRRTDWSRATDRMPASYADVPGRATVDGQPASKQADEGLDLVEAVTGALAVAAIAELARQDDPGPVREDAAPLDEEDVVAAAEDDDDSESGADPSDEKD